VAAAEKRAKEGLAHNVKKGPGGISRAHHPFWFEKFHWFVTSENCLVISAKDATQADLLIRRYMSPVAPGGCCAPRHTVLATLYGAI